MISSVVDIDILQFVFNELKLNCFVFWLFSLKKKAIENYKGEILKLYIRVKCENSWYVTYLDIIFMHANCLFSTKSDLLGNDELQIVIYAWVFLSVFRPSEWSSHQHAERTNINLSLFQSLRRGVFHLIMLPASLGIHLHSYLTWS